MLQAMSPPLSLTAQAFRDLASVRLHARATEGLQPMTASDQVLPPSDFDLNPAAFADWRGGDAPRPAAVLVPIVARDDLTVLLTQRTDHLPAHAGQISFPGGKPHPEDDGPLATALREAQEEIGLQPEAVTPLGFLDTYRTGTGYAVTPVVALVAPTISLSLNNDEVADAFEVPLAFLMDPANHRIEARTLSGRSRHFYAMPYGDRYIWGATAGILRNMQVRLFEPLPGLLT